MQFMFEWLLRGLCICQRLFFPFRFSSSNHYYILSAFASFHISLSLSLSLSIYLYLSLSLSLSLSPSTFSNTFLSVHLTIVLRKDPNNDVLKQQGRLVTDDEVVGGGTEL